MSERSRAGGKGNTGTPIAFFDAVNGYQRTAVIAGALQLDLFSIIGQGAREVDEIAARCNASLRGIRILCDTLTIHGFLLKEGERYALSADSATFLDRSSPAFIGDATEFLLHPRLRDAFNDVAGTVRKGGTLLADEGTVGHEDPVWSSFASGMAAVMHMPAELLAEKVLERIPAPAAILDISASHGEFGFAFARRQPEVKLYLLDWPSVLIVTERRAAAQGLNGRVHSIPGDLFTVAYPSDIDLVLLPNILHHFDRTRCVTLLSRARNSLKANGAVVILEFIPNDDRVTPIGSALFAMVMLCSTPQGDAYTFAEYDQMLRESGYSGAEMFGLAPGMQQAIIARCA